MEIYTKDSLIARLKEIREIGWIENRRTNNVGGVGNTLKYLEVLIQDIENISGGCE